MNCGKCGGETWNNTEKVKGGWNGPVFKCKDKSCDWVMWPPKGEKKSAPQKQTNGAKWTWPQLSVTYRRALLIANQHVPQVLKNATATDVVAAAATLFIAASRDGVSEPVKEQPATSQPLHERPAALSEPDDSDVPF